MASRSGQSSTVVEAGSKVGVRAVQMGNDLPYGSQIAGDGEVVDGIEGVDVVRRQRSGVGGDVRPEAVGQVEQSIASPAVEVAGEERGEEGIARSHRVFDGGVESGVMSIVSFLPETGPSVAKRHADRRTVKSGGKAFERRFLPARQIKPALHPLQLVAVQLYGVGGSEGVLDHASIVMRGAQVDVEDADDVQFTELPNGLSRGFGPLGKASEDECLRVLGPLLQRIRERNGIPRNRLDDLVIGLPGLIEVYANEPGGKRPVDLHELGCDAVNRHAPQCFFAQPIVSHPTRECSVLPKRVQVTDHVERRPAQKQTVGEGIPQNFTDAQNLVAHIGGTHNSREQGERADRPGRVYASDQTDLSGQVVSSTS